MMMDKLVWQANLEHIALLLLINYSHQQSMTLFSQLIFGITPTSPSLSTQWNNSNRKANRCAFTHYIPPVQSLPTFRNDCSPPKLLRKPKHLIPATEIAINLGEMIFKSS